MSAAMEKDGLEVSPKNIVLDKATGTGEVKIINRSNDGYAFKVKTTHPETYSVKASLGVVPKGQEATITISCTKAEKDSDTRGHKFLIKLLPCNARMSANDLKELFSLEGLRPIDKKLSVLYEGALPQDAAQKKKRKIESNFFFSIVVIFVMYQLLLLAKKLIFGG